MSKRKIDQTGIDYSLKPKHIKKDNENHDDNIIFKKIEKSINPKDKELFNKANDILHEDALSESTNLNYFQYCNPYSSSNNEICFVYKTTPDNSVCSCTQDEEEPEA